MIIQLSLIVSTRIPSEHVRMNKIFSMYCMAIDKEASLTPECIMNVKQEALVTCIERFSKKHAKSINTAVELFTTST